MLIQLKKEINYCFSNSLIKSHLYISLILLIIYNLAFKTEAIYYLTNYSGFWEGYYYFFSISVLISVYFSSTICYQLIKREGKYLKFYLQKKALLGSVITFKISILSLGITLLQTLILLTFFQNTRFTLENYNPKFLLTEALFLFTTNFLFVSITATMITGLQDFSQQRTITYKNLLNFMILAIIGVVVIFFNTFYLKQYYDFLYKKEVIDYNIAALSVLCEAFLILMIVPLLYKLAFNKLVKDY